MVKTNIIGYIHICQEYNWKKSFNLLLESIKKSKLYEASDEIRLGIVNNKGVYIDDEKFHDSKFKVINNGFSHQYERPTLLHMRKYSEIDDTNTIYWYLHTKGITHFGTPKENNVLDWIKLMLYWNIELWEFAVKKLKNNYDTYGCNAIHTQHYSGNFWWATSKHIKTLPKYIKDYYTAPEDWVCVTKNKMYNVYSSGLEGNGHYKNLYPASNYRLPNNFNIDAYRLLNKDLERMDDKQCIKHYLTYGKNENRLYKIPDDFNTDAYRLLNKDLENMDDKQCITHYLTYGKNENRSYKF